MFKPFESSNAYLVDMEGKIVHRWKGETPIGHPYLLDKGDIVYCTEDAEPLEVFTAAGGNGVIHGFL
jgi:hypothetical protein